MKNIIYTVFALSAAMALAATAAAKKPAPKPVQQGTLGNEKLQYDAMMGVAAKAGTLGCDKIAGVQPFVTRMPSGAVGSRSWQEMWQVRCNNGRHNIVIDFREARGGADWLIK